MAFDKNKYDQEYNKAHIRRKFIPFNDNNPDDCLMLECLEQQGNVTQYIKQLIRDDMKRGVWNFFEEPDEYYHYECSNCGEWLSPGVWDTNTKPYDAGFIFCPYCGVKMTDSLSKRLSE